jgi:signal recognition particle subunit SEC65
LKWTYSLRPRFLRHIPKNYLSHNPHLLGIILFNVREKGITCTNEGEKENACTNERKKGTACNNEREKMTQSASTLGQDIKKL